MRLKPVSATTNVVGSRIHVQQTPAIAYCKIAEKLALADNLLLTKSSLFNYQKIAENSAIAEELRGSTASALLGSPVL